MNSTKIDPALLQEFMDEHTAYTSIKKMCPDGLEVHPLPEKDDVNNPDHYTFGSIECIDAIKASMTPTEFRGAMKFNIIKYLWRWDHKGGPKDLEKARFYLECMIDSAKDDAGKERL